MSGQLFQITGKIYKPLKLHTPQSIGKILSECERTAKLSGVKNPLEYCKCTLEELMILYPSEAEAKNLTVLELQALAVKCNLF